MGFTFNSDNKKKIQEILPHYETKQAALLPLLHLAQEQNGYISSEVEEEVAKLLGLPIIKVREVTSFYTLYEKKPCGKIPIRVCRNLSCTLAGANPLLEYMKQKLGIEVGESTKDGRFRLESVECLCACETAPMMQVGDHYHGFLTKEKVDQILQRPDQATQDQDPETVFCPSENPILSKNFHQKEAKKLAYYAETGGYQMAQKALKMKPEAVTEEVKLSNLRGLGGAGFATGVKWGFLPKGNKKPVYLAVNADEGEPGTFKDRYIMERDPHRLIEGIIITCHAIQSHKAYIYIRGEYVNPARILQEAIDEAYQKGYLGKKIFGTRFDLDIIIHLGAGAYICGEETALLESLEGKKGFPRLKPPFPAVIGLFGCPTIINNVETLSCLPTIIEGGGTAFADLGCEKNGGTHLFSLSGHVERPGVYELPMGTSLRELIFQYAGGIPNGRTLKAVVPGGMSAAILKADEIDVGLDYDSLKQAKTMLGSAGIIVMDETVSMVEALFVTARFFSHESCGQCSPCREGTGWYFKVIKRIYEGKGRVEDLETLIRISKNMAGNTICAFADGAAMPFSSYPVKFRDEFEQYIREGKKSVQTLTEQLV